MRKKNSQYEFWALAAFLAVAALLLSNGFVGRIAAQGEDVDVYREIEPVGIVLDTILDEYVREPELGTVVEGALVGMMNSLDRHSGYISAEELQQMREDTQGEFEGIGVSIKKNEEGNIMVYAPIPDSPAAEAGLQPFDIIVGIDDISTEGMSLSDAADRIRGPRGTTVKLTILRKKEKNGEPELLDFDVKRAKVPLESIKEARMLEGGIGYVRISDFKDTTAEDLGEQLEEFLDAGMTALVLDLRWNPGGLLSAAPQTCELFLPKDSLVTYTRGRVQEDGSPHEQDMKLYTERRPQLPPDLPVAVLVNSHSASSAEIVTGALQYYKRAIVVGEKTFGKGSVQTIIPLSKPEEAALRLTTALYYTPADVTIDRQGIRPDVEVVMELEQEQALALQMYESYKDDPSMMNKQNHGAVTGNEVTEDTVEDTQLAKAVEILRENPVWERILEKYHKAVSETQVAASPEKEEEFQPEKLDAAEVLQRFQEQSEQMQIEDKSETEIEQREEPEEKEPAPAP